MTSSPPAAAAPPRGREDDLSVLEVLTPLVRRWQLVVVWPAAFAITTAVVSLVIPSAYTAEATFTPIATSASGLGNIGGLAGLAGLAGQLGLGTTPGANVSPEYFGDLLHSREILTSTLLSSFPDPDAHAATPERALIDILAVKGATEAERIGKGVRKLDRQVRTSVDKQTGVVTLQVRQRTPGLAAAVANRMIGLLNEFNLQRRQSQSRAQRQFTEQRLEQAERELRDAEGAQLHFLEANRRYSESPLLAFQEARLERAVQLKQEVFLTLRKALEEARIAEVRDTPVLTIIDAAVPPDRRSSPRRVLDVLVALVLGCFVGVVAALVSDLGYRMRRDGRPDYGAFKAALTDARRDIASVFRRR